MRANRDSAPGNAELGLGASPSTPTSSTGCRPGFTAMKEQGKSGTQESKQKEEQKAIERTVLPCCLTFGLTTPSARGQAHSVISQNKENPCSVPALSVLETEQKTPKRQHESLRTGQHQLFWRLHFKTLNKLLSKTPLC